MAVLAALLVLVELALAQQQTCIKGNCVDGQGTLVFDDGSRYVGHFSHGQFDGEGMRTFADGVTFTGKFEHGLAAGAGNHGFGEGCHVSCAKGCLNLQITPQRACGNCKADRGPGWCRPGAKGWANPLTPAETAESAMSALVAGLTACAALEAAVQTHVKYFWKQQDAERAFVRSLPGVCAATSDDHHYYFALHALRRPMSDAVNRHVRGAFYVKAACTSAGFEITPSTHEMYICNPPVLEHEPFNVAEGFYVVNLTNHLLHGGRAALCASGPAATAKRVARWTAELEDVMARHKGNTAFDDLWHRFKGYCATFAHAASPRVSTARKQWVTIDCEDDKIKDGRNNDGPADRADSSRSLPRLAGVSCADARAAAPGAPQVAAGIDSKLRSPPDACPCASGPPCTHAVIEMFGNDTLALLEVARRTAVAAYAASCPAGARASPRADRIAALKRATEERRGRYNPTPVKLYTSMVLATVYHKLVPYCGVDVLRPSSSERKGASGGPTGFRCDGRHGSSGARQSSPVMDLVPAPDAARCGDATPVRCADAAAAVAQYHALLQRITPFRRKLLAAMFSETSHRDTQKAAPGQMFATVAKRFAKESPACDPGLEKLVDDALALPPLLREALRALHAAAPALDVACVADSRRATVALAPGTNAKLAAFVQAAATNRVFRSVGGLPLKMVVGDGPVARDGGSSALAITGTDKAATSEPLDPLFVVGTVGIIFGCLVAFIHHKMKQTVARMFPPPGERYSDGDSAGSSYFDSSDEDGDGDSHTRRYRDRRRQRGLARAYRDSRPND